MNYLNKLFADSAKDVNNYFKNIKTSDFRSFN